MVSWVEDCHGDTYAAFASGDGGLHGQSRALLRQHRRLSAEQHLVGEHEARAGVHAERHGTINHDQIGYHDWFGHSSPSLMNWFPDFYTGSYTGQGQAAWTITGNSQYVVTGGEFPA